MASAFSRRSITKLARPHSISLHLRRPQINFYSQSTTVTPSPPNPTANPFKMSGTIDLYDQVIPPMIRTTKNLKAILAKAEPFFAEKGTSDEEVFKLCMIADMRPFAFQFMAMNFNAREAGAMVAPGTEKNIAPLTDNTFKGANAFLDAQLAFLEALPHTTTTEQEANTDQVITIPAGRVLFTPKVFVQSFCLPNFYFHATTIYDLLRAQGVPLGKGDFLGRDIFRPAP